MFQWFTIGLFSKYTKSKNIKMYYDRQAQLKFTGHDMGIVCHSNQLSVFQIIRGNRINWMVGFGFTAV